MEKAQMGTNKRTRGIRSIGYIKQSQGQRSAGQRMSKRSGVGAESGAAATAAQPSLTTTGRRDDDGWLPAASGETVTLCRCVSLWRAQAVAGAVSHESRVTSHHDDDEDHHHPFQRVTRKRRVEGGEESRRKHDFSVASLALGTLLPGTGT
jgi:hypothetical protein